MKILIVGDSFVAGSGAEGLSYAFQLQYKKTIDVTVLDFAGGGNDVIAHHVLKNFSDYNAIIINWTSSCRYDVCYSDSKKIKIHKGRSCQHNEGEKLWIHSGGWRGSWQIDSTKPLFHTMYKNHFDIEDSWRRTLTHMLTIDVLLKNKPHLHLFSFNTFECVSFGDYEKNLEKEYNKSKWGKYKDQNKWLDLIDWSNVWFHINQKSSTGGIIDWCHDNTEDIGHHPSKESHTKFLNDVVEPWINNINEK